LDNEIEMELRLIVIARPPQRRKAAAARPGVF
jgi:hypothetical protein